MDEAVIAMTMLNPLRDAWETTKRRRAVMSDPRLNKGVAFTADEREALDLHGLLPPRVLTLDQQAERAYEQYSEEPTAVARNRFLAQLHGRNEVLFYRLFIDHLAEMLPVAYTPTIGEAIQRYSHDYRRPGGLYLSVETADRIADILAATELGPDDVDLIVATDGEAILGIGDWGIGGIDIAVGKLSVYTAAGGIDPSRTIAVMLDVGTNRAELLDDPLYLGIPHRRVDPAVYDAFIDRYVAAARTLFPRAMLHWEDFGTANARRILQRYRHDALTFNDDMQGTGAVNLAAVLAGIRVSGVPLDRHRVVIFGAGTAGIGIADQLRDAMIARGCTGDAARRSIWCVDRHGLLTTSSPDVRAESRPYARPDAEVADWAHDQRVGGVPLAEVVRRVHPTVLVGTSTMGGAFSEQIVRDMAAHCVRPIILPMSNPTPLAEAVPTDLIAWTDGRALVATGSPFRPVDHDGVRYEIGQANNALVFPGVGLGVIVSRARRVTDGMISAAASAVADLVDASRPGAPLLPPVESLRETSVAVALAVARAASADGVASADLGDDPEQLIRSSMWQPRYRPVIAV